MHGDHRLVERARLAGRQPVQPGEQHLLEQVRFQVTGSELKQPGCGSPSGRQRFVMRPAGQARRDSASEILDRFPPDRRPRAALLKQAAHRLELGTGQVNVLADGGLDDPAQPV